MKWILRFTTRLALAHPRSVIDNLSLIGDHLSLEGHRRANSSSLQSNLPISSSGSIVFSLDQLLFSIWRVSKCKCSSSILDPRILHLFADLNLQYSMDFYLLTQKVEQSTIMWGWIGTQWKYSYCKFVEQTLWKLRTISFANWNSITLNNVCHLETYIWITSC